MPAGMEKKNGCGVVWPTICVVTQSVRYLVVQKEVLIFTECAKKKKKSSSLEHSMYMQEANKEKKKDNSRVGENRIVHIEN